jgi:hypothetical protein
VRNIRRFLQAPGPDFCFVGEEYRIQAAGKDFFLDLSVDILDRINRGQKPSDFGLEGAVTPYLARISHQWHDKQAASCYNTCANNGL